MSDVMSHLPSSVQCAALPDWRVIRASGADAVSFLHAQLTQDVSGLQAGDVRLAAYCNAKGRMQASMLIWRELDAGSLGEAVFMLVHASVAEALVKRLRMFVLRAKVVLELTQAAVYGLWCEDLAANAVLPGQQRQVAQGYELLGAREAEGVAWRAWLISAEGGLPEGLNAQGEGDEWRMQEIASGTPWVTQGNFELFTPLIVNLDLIDGVSFTKGCYPGQEVVARSHYRGKQKRRMLRAIAELAGSEGAQWSQLDGKDICSPEAREPLGYIVNSVVYQNRVHLLFEANVAAAQTQELRLLTPEGLPAELQALPYPLPADTA